MSQAALSLNLDNLRAEDDSAPASAQVASQTLNTQQESQQLSTSDKKSHALDSSIAELQEFADCESPLGPLQPAARASTAAVTPPRQQSRAGGVFDALASGGRYLEQGVAAAHSVLSPAQATPHTPAAPVGAQLPDADAAWAHKVGVGGPSVLASTLNSAAAPNATGKGDYLAAHAAAPPSTGLDAGAGAAAPYLSARPLTQAATWLTQAAGGIKGVAAQGMSYFSAPPTALPPPDAAEGVFSGASITAGSAQQTNVPPDSLIGACLWLLAPMAAVVAGKCTACVDSCTGEGGGCNCRAAHVALWLLHTAWRLTLLAFSMAWRILHLLWGCCLPAGCRHSTGRACQRARTAALGVSVKQGALCAALGIVGVLIWAYRSEFAASGLISSAQETQQAHE